MTTYDSNHSIRFIFLRFHPKSFIFICVINPSTCRRIEQAKQIQCKEKDEQRGKKDEQEINIYKNLKDWQIDASSMST